MTTITLTPAERSHLLLALSFMESELPEHYSLLRKLDACMLIAALESCAKAGSAAEVESIVDAALAAYNKNE